jgi:hypothetical protein
VVIGIQKQPGANTLELTARIDRELDAIQRGLPEGMIIERDKARQADFIGTAVRNVSVALRDGAILVAVILFLFLFQLRPTLISLASLPLSLLVAVIAMDALGITVNTMSLGGLTIAIGALVDDAIIDVENVVRRLRENAARPSRAARRRRRDLRGVARGPRVDRVRHADRHAGVRAAVLPGRRRGPPAAAARGRLPGRDLRVAGGRADAHAGAVRVRAAAPVRRRCARRRVAGADAQARLPAGAESARCGGPARGDHRRAGDAGGGGGGRAVPGPHVPPRVQRGRAHGQRGDLPGTSLEQSDQLGRRVEEVLLSFPEVVSTAGAPAAPSSTSTPRTSTPPRSTCGCARPTDPRRRSWPSCASG